jgi:hypothetical protein
MSYKPYDKKTFFLRKRKPGPALETRIKKEKHVFYCRWNRLTPHALCLLIQAKPLPTRPTERRTCMHYYGWIGWMRGGEETTWETREGWPLLTVETEVNGNSKRTNERGPSLVGLLGLSCRYRRFVFSLGCSSRPSTKYFFLTAHYFYFPFLSPLPSDQGRGRLSLSMYLWRRQCQRQ